MIHVLGLLARKGHGKSTAAKYLVEKYDAKLVAFATPLKKGVQKAFKFTDAQMWGTQAEKEAVDPRYNLSPRDFLRLIGTEVLRDHFDQEIHLKKLLSTLRELDDRTDYDQLYVVEDMRFPNEAAFIAEGEDFHGANIKLICDDEPVVEDSHMSEAGIDLVDPLHVAAEIHHMKALGLEDLYSKLDFALHGALLSSAFGRVLLEGAERVARRKAA